jgi:hypothetical protein
MSPLCERIELLLPWQSPESNASYPTRIASVQAFTTRAQPCLSPVSQRNDASPGHILVLGSDSSFDYKETIETHNDLNRSPQH